MKYLITGATGFIGSTLCEYLTKNGHQVYYQARSEKKLQSLNLLGTKIISSLYADKKHDFVDSLPKDLDVVIHTAGVVHSFNVDEFYKSNTFITRRLIIDLKKRYPSLTFCLISSQAAAGPTKGVKAKKESDIELPVSDYGRSKLASEKTLMANAPDSWNRIIIRPPMVIGPRDTAMLEVFKLVKNSFVPVAGVKGFNNSYSFVSVFDLIEGIYKSTLLKSSDTFFIAHPDKISYNQLIDTIADSLKKERVFKLSIPIFFLKIVAFLFMVLNKIFKTFSPRLTPDKIFEIKERSWLCDSTKSKKILGINYKDDLKRIIALTCTDYKKRNWL